ncbi:MAG: enoyl-CoA hydratase/isomerase family protein [Acidimicrobiales bacterium]|jgi:enoyl-CoA hydratase/carnithine racemase
MTATGQFTKIEVAKTDGITVLTLASDKVNALDVDTLEEVTACIDECEHDASVRALVVTGKGAIFSAGLNVGEVLDNDADRTGVLLDALGTALVRLFGFPKPTVAAVNGPAIAGGCILACACDKRLIAEGARIGATELKVGVSFPVVAVELLRHACGAAAEQVMFDAALYDADGSCRTGLAHRAVPAADLQAEAAALAGTLAELDVLAYALAKAASRRVALSVVEDAASRALDRRVLAHWQDDRTRDNLEQLRKPKA